MDPEYTNRLNVFLQALLEASRTIKSITQDNWGIIGSTALAVRGLTATIPKDVDIVVSDRDLRSICKYFNVEYPEKTFGDDKRLCSNKVTLSGKDRAVIIEVAANLQYLSPTGVYETIDPNEFRTEYVACGTGYIWNVVTTGTYMSLAGRFNRVKDRDRLKYLYSLPSNQ